MNDEMVRDGQTALVSAKASTERNAPPTRLIAGVSVPEVRASRRRSSTRSQADEVGRILSAFPRLRMKEDSARRAARLVQERPETSHDNFLRDFGERFVPGYKAVSTVDLLIKAPFDE